MTDVGNRLLYVENVVKAFGGLRAVDHATLAVEKGEIRGLIGPNGSGKTTLINLVTGIYHIDRGAVYFSGAEIHKLKPHQISAKGIMRTFQIARIFKDMTTIENMMISALPQGDSHDDAKCRAEELLEFALLGDLGDEPAKNLSGGQKMLLQIVRGFMNRKLRLYILDEPFAGVHQTIKGVILKTIRKMNEERGITFLIVSHEMTTITAVCDKISVLCKGKVISQGTMEEIANDPSVIDAYLGG